MDRLWSQLEKIASAPTVPDLVEHSVQAFALLGFRASYYVGVVSADPRVGRIASCCGFADNANWERLYRSRLYLDDPLPTIGLSHLSAIRWSSVSESFELTPGQCEYLGLLQKHSRSDGIGIPCFGPGSRCGFVGIGGVEDEKAFAAENVLKAEVAGKLSFQRFCEIVLKDSAPRPKLSKRELDALELMAEGKSNSVIADILGLSKSTVDSYVSRIFDKLDVRDRTTAAVRALSLGLINPSEYSDFEIAYFIERNQNVV